MIGGIDIIIPAIGNPAALDDCVRVIRRYWPRARYEDAISGEKLRDYNAVPSVSIKQLLIYRDERAEEAWDSENPEAPPNTMIYLILSTDFVTVVLDDPNAEEMRLILESVRSYLGMDILNTVAEAA